MCIPLNDNLTLYIRAGYNGRFVVYVKDKEDQYVGIPDELTIYNIYRQRYWDMNSDQKFYVGLLLDVYEIYYNKLPILNNTEYCTMEEFFEVCITTDNYYYTTPNVLCKGNVTKNTNVLSLSTLEGIDIGYTIKGPGIPIFTTVTDIHYPSKKVKISQKATETFTNATITII
jgi:hypothetical protein